MSYYISIWHVSKQMETSKFHKKDFYRELTNANIGCVLYGLKH